VTLAAEQSVAAGSRRNFPLQDRPWQSDPNINAVALSEQ
jgi:hypothetical protein